MSSVLWSKLWSRRAHEAPVILSQMGKWSTPFGFPLAPPRMGYMGLA
jgi:hypothetical protein